MLQVELLTNRNEKKKRDDFLFGVLYKFENYTITLITRRAVVSVSCNKHHIRGAQTKRRSTGSAIYVRRLNEKCMVKMYCVGKYDFPPVCHENVGVVSPRII